MKNAIVFVILCLIYILALFVNQKIIWSFYVVFLIFILLSRHRLVFKPFNILITLSLPLIWTIILSYNYSFYSNIQGFFYMSLPVIMVIMGYQIFKLLTFNQFLIYLIYIGTILSLIYISIVIYKVGFRAFLSPYEEARFVVGSGSPASILALIVSAYSKQYGLKLFKDKIQKVAFIIINLAGIYLFASRTYWVVLAIFLVMYNLKLIAKHQIIFFFIFCAGLLFVVLFPIKVTGEITTTKSLFVKMIKTFSELQISNFQTYSDINIHFRGYEAYRALMTYLDGSFFNLLFGHGLGKHIDLKTPVYLAGQNWSTVPWIHNGYFFVLVKEGAIGLVSLIAFFVHVIWIGYRNLGKKNTEKRFISLLIISCTFSLILTNYVISSMFTIEMAIFLITVGVLIQKLSSKDLAVNKIAAYNNQT
jgi:hypothetical protein